MTIDVTNWLKEHKLFSISGMCKKIGIDRANFHKVVNSPNPRIKPEVLEKIVAIISEYGFKPQKPANKPKK